MIPKISVILTFPILLFAHAFGQKIVEDANVEQRLLNGSFTSIKIHGSLQVWLSQDAAESIAVSADHIPDIKTVYTAVDNGVLVISGGRGKEKERSRVYISFKTLEKLEVSGVASVEVIGSVQQEKLQLLLSGVSEFSAPVSLNDLTVDVSGVSKAQLSGKVKNAIMIASGTAGINALDLQTEKCSILASGSCKVNVGSAIELTVRARGSSEIGYRGNPKISQNLSGRSRLVRME